MDDERRTVVWGTGSDEVIEYTPRLFKRGFKSGVVTVKTGINEIAGLDDADRVEVRGEGARMIATGDPPLGQITIGWTSGACDYTVRVGPGLTFEEAESYAGRL